MTIQNLLSLTFNFQLSTFNLSASSKTALVEN